jgi:hypothetical protein
MEQIGAWYAATSNVAYSLLKIHGACSVTDDSAAAENCCWRSE